jgi:hypothetical protein
MSVINQLKELRETYPKEQSPIYNGSTVITSRKRTVKFIKPNTLCNQSTSSVIFSFYNPISNTVESQLHILWDININPIGIFTQEEIDNIIKYLEKRRYSLNKLIK